MNTPPSSPASGSSILIVRPVAVTALIITAICFGVATFGISTFGLGVALGPPIECVDRDQCADIVAADEMTTEDVEALVGPGFADSFSVTCLRTAATRIRASCGQLSYEGRVPSGATASVVVGDSAITASAGGITYAAGERFGGNFREEWCRTTLDAGVAVEVRAICASAP